MTIQLQVFAPETDTRPVALSLPISMLADQAVTAIANAMRERSVALLGASFGKDSTVCLGLTLEAARRLKAQGIQKPIVLITSDTGVENPAVTRLANRMSAQALDFARQHGLDVTQEWVSPPAVDNYLVQMLGGRSTASVPGSSASCSVDLKIRPMQRVRDRLAKEYGAENILTLIGTRFDESEARKRRMIARAESATTAIEQDNGSWLMSPVADWVEGNVWAFLNASEKRLGFPTLDFSRTLALYESIGETTCSIGAIDPGFSRNSSSCSGGRTGCWACMKVSRDESLEAMLDQFPAFEPLVRLAKIIRAGHNVPGNRSYLARSLDENGNIRVFSNAYAPNWTAQLLRWTLTIDAEEDDRAASTGKPRRFERLLKAEHMMMIGFLWARSGLHRPGEFIRIVNDVLTGHRFALLEDHQIEAMAAKADKRQIGKTLGVIETGIDALPQPAYRDGWRDLAGGLASFDAEASACGVAAMDQGETYRAGNGTDHDGLINQPGVTAHTEHLLDISGEEGIVWSDFLWWWSMEFATGTNGHEAELNWLLREGLIQVPRGYQSQVVRYQQFGRLLQDLDLPTDQGGPEALIDHQAFRAAGAKVENQISLLG